MMPFVKEREYHTYEGNKKRERRSLFRLTDTDFNFRISSCGTAWVYAGASIDSVLL